MQAPTTDYSLGKKNKNKSPTAKKKKKHGQKKRVWEECELWSCELRASSGELTVASCQRRVSSCDGK